MAEKSYVFNDTETTGLNTWFSISHCKINNYFVISDFDF